MIIVIIIIIIMIITTTTTRVTSAYLSSERDVNMYVGVPEAMDRVSYHVMKRRGYHMIDMHDMTPAFTYDTATQYDGMHIIGTY